MTLGMPQRPKQPLRTQGFRNQNHGRDHVTPDGMATTIAVTRWDQVLPRTRTHWSPAVCATHERAARGTQTATESPPGPAIPPRGRGPEKRELLKPQAGTIRTPADAWLREQRGPGTQWTATWPQNTNEGHLDARLSVRRWTHGPHGVRFRACDTSRGSTEGTWVSGCQGRPE